MIPRHLIIGIVVMVVVALGMSFYVLRMRGNAGRVSLDWPRSAWRHARHWAGRQRPVCI